MQSFAEKIKNDKFPYSKKINIEIYLKIQEKKKRKRARRGKPSVYKIKSGYKGKKTIKIKKSDYVNLFFCLNTNVDDKDFDE